MEMITDLYLFLLSTVLISLSGVMMPGPVFAVTITKGYKDKIAGALIAFGHGVIEFPLMFLIYFGFAQFFSSNAAQILIGVVGGLMLTYMGIEMFKSRRKTHEEGKNPEHASFFAGIITTTANPYFFLWWATVGTALIMNASIFGITGFIVFAITHWLCDFLWDTFVSVTVFKSRRFWTKKVHEIVFGFCSVVLVAFGAWFIVSVFL